MINLSLYATKQFLLKLFNTLLLCFCLLKVSSGQEPQYIFERYNTSSPIAIPQNYIWSLYEDNDGDLWIGTEEGAAIFDGFGTKHLSTRPFDKNVITGSVIQAVLHHQKDNVNQFLIGHYNGLDILNFQNGVNNQNRPYDKNRPDSVKTCLEGMRVYSLLEYTIEQKTRILIGTNKGLKMIDNYQGSGTIREKTINAYGNKSINDIAKIGDLLYMATDSGLYIVPSKDIKSPKTHLFDDEKILDIAEGESNIWIATSSNNVYKLSKDGKDPLKLTYKGIKPTCLLEYRNRNDKKLWIGTKKSGLIVSDIPDEEVEDTKYSFVKHSYANDRSISANIISSIIKDKNNNIWIGTEAGGLNRYQLTPFTHFLNLEEKEEKELGVIWSFFEDQDSVIWIGTSGGLRKKSKDGKIETVTDFIPRIRSIIGDGTTHLYLGTRDNGLVRFNKKNSKYELLTPTDYAMDDDIKTLYRVNADSIIIGTIYKGAFLCNSRTPYDSTRTPLLYDGKPLPGIFAIEKDSMGNYWFGTMSGLFLFDKNFEYKAQFKYDDIDKRGTCISDDYILSVKIDPRSTVDSGTLKIWVGTDNGLNLLSVSTESVYDTSKYTYRYLYKNMTDFEEFIPNSTIYRIEFSHNYVWLSTDKGIVAFGLDKMSKASGDLIILEEDIYSYTYEQGLQDNEFNSGASLMLRNSKLVFGGINGFNEFSTEEVTKLIPEKIYNMNIKFGDRDSIPLDLNTIVPISYLKSKGRVSIIVECQPKCDIYETRIYIEDGKFPFRLPLESSGVIDLPKNSLKPGEHLIEIFDNQTGRVLKSIKYKVYNLIPNIDKIQTGIIIIFIIFPIGAFFLGRLAKRAKIQAKEAKKRANKANKEVEEAISRKEKADKQVENLEKRAEEAKKEAKAAERRAEKAERTLNADLKALRTQMPTHFIRNILASIEYLSEEIKDGEHEEKHKEMLYELVQKFRYVTEKIMKHVKMEFVDINQEIGLLQEYLEVAIIDAEYNYENLKITSNIDAKEVNKEFRIPPLLLQPLVENAIGKGIVSRFNTKKSKKFEGKVKIKFTNEGDILTCSIFDNGIGYENKSIKKGKRGISISNIKERMTIWREKTDGDIDDFYFYVGSPIDKEEANYKWSTEATIKLNTSNFKTNEYE